MTENKTIEELKKILALRLNKAGEIKYDSCIIATQDLENVLNLVEDQAKEITNGMEREESLKDSFMNIIETLEIDNTVVGEKTIIEAINKLKQKNKELIDSKVGVDLSFEDYIPKKKIIKFVKEQIADEDYMEDDIDTDIEPASYDKYINSRKLLEFVEEQSNMKLSKFEANVSEFKSNIQKAKKGIKAYNEEIKLILEKKDKVIDLMANWIINHEGPFKESFGSEKCETIKSVLCIGKTDTCKECIKKGFYKKVEEQENYETK